jgi:3',5'-cyclic AMP phosphodiesterase CpdA
LHIVRPGALAYGYVDTAAALANCVAQLNRLAPRPDLVVISGDLTDTALAQEYDHVKELLAPLEIPLALIPGNHDARAPLRAAFPEQRYHAGSDALNLARRVGPVDVLLLDSSVPGKPHGELDADTLHWLDVTLGSSATRPALLFLHHPPFLTGIGHMDRQNLRNAGDLAALIRRHRRARLVAAGHVHRATLTVFEGIAATICPAPNHAVDLDLGALRPAAFVIEPPGLHLHAWFSGVDFGAVVTHFVPIGTHDGPHPFSASRGKQP